MISFQRFESGVIFLALIIANYYIGFSWLWFLVFLVLPDISMIGYLKNSKVGAVIYNVGHNYGFPVLILLVSAFIGSDFGGLLSIAWAAHIAFDRLLGFGLKLGGGFKDTHLGKL